MSKFLALTIGCLLLCSATADEVPTIAISCGNTPLVTLPKYQQSVDTLGFRKVLSQFWNEHTKVVMVLEDELSLEDFTTKDSNGHSLFQLFETVVDRRFFPSVDQPEKAIEMLSKNGFSVKTYDDNTFTNSSGKVIALTDLNENNRNNDIENRQAMLLRHNNDISKMFSTLCKQYTNVVLILSGKTNPWIAKTQESSVHHLITRHLMAIDNQPTKLKIVDSKGKALIYSASYPTVSIDNGPETQLQSNNADVFVDDSRDNLLKVGTTFFANNTKTTLRFRFDRTTFSWELKGIEYESIDSSNLLIPQQAITAQMGLSYFAEGPVVFSKDGIVLKFNNKFQVQPWLRSSSGSVKFGDPQEQDSFFTAPILAGLFVTALMLFIVTWGITMIMDIKTMDRFDDPKGKTISINVVE